MYRAALSTKGQLVLPKAIRERLGLQAGDKIDFVIHENGDVFLRRAAVHVQSLRGCLRPPNGKVASIEDMERAIRKGAAGLL